MSAHRCSGPAGFIMPAFCWLRSPGARRPALTSRRATSRCVLLAKLAASLPPCGPAAHSFAVLQWDEDSALKHQPGGLLAGVVSPRCASTRVLHSAVHSCVAISSSHLCACSARFAGGRAARDWRRVHYAAQDPGPRVCQPRQRHTSSCRTATAATPLPELDTRCCCRSHATRALHFARGSPCCFAAAWLSHSAACFARRMLPEVSAATVSAMTVLTAGTATFEFWLPLGLIGWVWVLQSAVGFAAALAGTRLAADPKLASPAAKGKLKMVAAVACGLFTALLALHGLHGAAWLLISIPTPRLHCFAEQFAPDGAAHDAGRGGGARAARLPAVVQGAGRRAGGGVGGLRVMAPATAAMFRTGAFGRGEGGSVVVSEKR